jgi:O-antigen/teichoic acid export membrane protein
MHRQVLVDILASLLIFLLSWFLIKSNFNFVYLLSATVIANLIAAILLGFWVFSSHTLECSFDFSLIKSLAKEALPMGAILILFSMVDKIDTLILGILKGNQAVGVYSLVYRVYDVLILGAAYLMNVMLPVFAQYTDLAQNKPKIQQLYQQCFRLLFFAGISLMFLTWIFAPFMVHVLTQQRFPEFLDAIPVLRLLSLAMFFSYFNHLTGYTLVAFGQQRKYLFVPVLALAFNILANFIFIPQYSYFASATITVATEIIVLFITTRFVSRLLGLKLWTSAN